MYVVHLLYCVLSCSLCLCLSISLSLSLSLSPPPPHPSLPVSLFLLCSLPLSLSLLLLIFLIISRPDLSLSVFSYWALKCTLPVFTKNSNCNTWNVHHSQVTFVFQFDLFHDIYIYIVSICASFSPVCASLAVFRYCWRVCFLSHPLHSVWQVFLAAAGSFPQVWEFCFNSLSYHVKLEDEKHRGLSVLSRCSTQRRGFNVHRQAKSCPLSELLKTCTGCGIRVDWDSGRISWFISFVFV